jgi:predicted transcriptional regulator of viral defense system
MDKNLTKGEYLDILLRSPKTVFSTKDIALLWQGKENRISDRLSKYTKDKKLIRIERGLYAKDKEYDKNELATRIFTPSYISFETALAKAGVIFQFYSRIFVASYLTREKVIDGRIYSFRKIKNSILMNKSGIESAGAYFIASAERAFLDIVYLNTEYHFDNLSGIDWKKVYDILPIYGGNKRMAEKVERYEEAARKGLN